MSKRTDLLYVRVVQLHQEFLYARSVRNDLRDNYQAKLDDANALMDALKDERDDRLAKLNELRALEVPPLPPLTVQDLAPLVPGTP